MAQQRGKQREPAADPLDEEFDESASPVEEIMRRAIALGLTGFFTTEGAVRKALGDAVPKDWTDFLADTSERTRSEFLDRLSHEVGRVLEGLDLAEVLGQLLEGRTLEVKAEFKLSDRPGGKGPALSVKTDIAGSQGEDR
jgi:hypothetical protein